MSHTKLKHLLYRFGFGPRAKSWEKWAALPENAWWPKLKDDAAEAPSTLDVADTALKGLLMGVGDIGKMERRELDKAEKQQIREQSREGLRNLNLLWLDEMTHSKAQLREKMAFFWHGHFASRNINVLYQQQLLQVLRDHALGDFRALLRAVSKSAAMLAFLNNQQNRKKHPNENFAREVMELFTLGRGHYTETDVKEAARAFTGWGFRLNGDFAFRAFDHDAGDKTVLGKTGNFNGDDVLDILLEQRQTARFIARKLYRFLVNDEAAPEDRIQMLGDRFYDSGYQIMRLLDDIARSEWFYEPENMGAKIKSPIELWVGLCRALPHELDNPETPLLLEKALGQVLFFPPNVAGWPGGKNWVDSSALLLRLRIPQMLYRQSAFDLRPKSDDDQEMGRGRGNGAQRRFSAIIDWPSVEQLFAKAPPSQQVDAVAAWLLPRPPHAKILEAIREQAQASGSETALQRAVIYTMSIPEYQLC